MNPFRFGSAGEILLDGTPQTGEGLGISGSVSITIADNTDRCLICPVVQYGGINGVSSVKIGATNFTQGVAHDQHGATCEIWYLLNPPIGSQTVDVVFNADLLEFVIGAYSLYGVDQTTPIGATGAAGTSGGTPQPNGTITPTNAGSWIIDCIVANSNNATLTESLTLGYYELVSAGDPNRPLGSQYSATPTISSSNSMAWSGLTGGYNWTWAAVEVNAS